jgi:hypothetical protein
MTTHEIEWNKDGSIEVRVYVDTSMSQNVYVKASNPEMLTHMMKDTYVHELRDKCKEFIKATEPGLVMTLNPEGKIDLASRQS